MRRALALTAALLALTTTGCTGLAVGPDFGPSSSAVSSLGAHLVRAEFPIGASCSSMEPQMTAYANAGARVLALAGFDLRDRGLPTVAEAQSVAQWAVCYGPGSTWAQAHPNFALDLIEFGNETSYQYQNGCPEAHAGQGDWWASSCLTGIAQTYAARFMQARGALDFANHSDVKLLAQGDDGGSGNVSWVHNLKVGGLTSAAVGAWSVHAYGATPSGKLGNLINFTSAEGFSSSIPVDATEYGISSQECGGSPVFMPGDAQGWGNQLTYGQAATDLNAGMDAIRSFLGSRLGLIMIFSAKDSATVCTSSNRESFFGGVKADITDKGAYSTEVRDQLTQ